MKQNDKKLKSSNEQLLTFLRRTKEGEYAEIEESSLVYARMRERTEMVEPVEETIYYSVS